ncbi:MAG TPA: RNA methyltransferase [Caulobacteraceae bacterium]|nr:RNA methyltransferase [Caulobacteraceae bacterium]
MSATIVPIASPDDPRIVAYRTVRDRDVSGHGDHFVAEGEVVLRILVRPGGRCSPVSLLVSDKRLPRLAPLIEPLPADVPVYVAGQGVMDAVAGFAIHRGILAIGRRPADPGAAALLARLSSRALVVGLFGVGNHDNMGGLFRNAAAFGVGAVLLDPRCCDPLYRKAIRVSVGGALTVPFARLADGVDMLDTLAAADFAALALSPRGDADLGAVGRPPRAAVLFGAEGPGLPADVLARTRAVRIPMAAGWDSLNVASSSAIVLNALATLGV